MTLDDFIEAASDVPPLGFRYMHSFLDRIDGLNELTGETAVASTVSSCHGRVMDDRLTIVEVVDLDAGRVRLDLAVATVDSAASLTHLFRECNHVEERLFPIRPCDGDGLVIAHVVVGLVDAPPEPRAFGVLAQGVEEVRFGRALFDAALNVWHYHLDRPPRLPFF